MGNCWRNFFLFLPKNKNGNLGWGTLGDALTRIQDILLGYLHTEATVVPSIQAACMQVSRNWLLYCQDQITPNSCDNAWKYLGKY